MILVKLMLLLVQLQLANADGKSAEAWLVEALLPAARLATESSGGRTERRSVGNSTGAAVRTAAAKLPPLRPWEEDDAPLRRRLEALAAATAAQPPAPLNR